MRERADDLASSLPEGQRKLLDVAMALVLQPKLLIMDEPTSGVASEEKHGLMATVMKALDERQGDQLVRRARHRHRRAATRRGSRPGSRGKIAADGPPEQVLNDPEVMRKVLGEH